IDFADAKKFKTSIESALSEAKKKSPKAKFFYIDNKKSSFLNLFKSFGKQLNMFPAGGNREGETKEGKGGTLRLQRDQSGKGAHWRLVNKAETETKAENKNNAGAQQLGGSRVINPSKAFAILEQRMGNKIYATDKQGNTIGEGIFQLMNE